MLKILLFISLLFYGLSFLFLLLGQHTDGLLHIAAQLLRHLCDFEFLGLFRGIGEILLNRGFRSIDGRPDTAQADSNFLILPCRIIGLIDGQNLSFFLVGQSEQGLHGIELVDILALIQQNLAIGIVDDGILDNRT